MVRLEGVKLDGQPVRVAGGIYGCEHDLINRIGTKPGESHLAIQTVSGNGELRGSVGAIDRQNDFVCLKTGRQSGLAGDLYSQVGRGALPDGPVSRGTGDGHGQIGDGSGANPIEIDDIDGIELPGAAPPFHVAIVWIGQGDKMVIDKFPVPPELDPSIAPGKEIAGMKNVGFGRTDIHDLLLLHNIIYISPQLEASVDQGDGRRRGEMF